MSAFFPEALPSAVVLPFLLAFGLVFGSFVTALSYRLPRGLSIARGRSMCPACETPLTPRDLVPVFSWLLHRGRCRHCGTRISARYPAIEGLTAALFLVAGLWVADPLRLALILAATPVMVALAVIDIEHRKLPNVLLALLAALALGLCLAQERDLVVAFGMAAAVFAVALAIDWAGRKVAGQGLGMGDAKLMAVAALALPLIPLLMALAGGGLLGVATGLVVGGGRAAAKFPFGPALLLATWATVVAL